MLSTRNLEKLIELEASLRAEYQLQLDAKSAEIDAGIKKQEEQQTVIAKQLEQITSLSTEATANKRVEQQIRELESRSANLHEEVVTQKNRLKSENVELKRKVKELEAVGNPDEEEAAAA